MEALLRRMVRETRAKREREDEKLFQRHYSRGADEAEAPGAAVPLPGRRRYQRIMNELYLRELSGPLVAEDMAKMFSPVPFGESHESAFTRLRHQRGRADAFMRGVGRAATRGSAGSA